jgi:hypothetical protein
MEAWILVVWLASGANMTSVPGIESKEACEALQKEILQNQPHRGAAFKWHCTPYKIAAKAGWYFTVEAGQSKIPETFAG